MARCVYCQEEATHIEENPYLPLEDSDGEKKDWHFCNRHAAERLLVNQKIRVNEIPMPV